MQLDHRTIQIYDLPLRSDIDILQPEYVTLRFYNGRTIDIGALCYLIRQPSFKTNLGNKRTTLTGKLVQLNSICEQRKCDIRLLISFISENITHSGKRKETIRDMIARLVVFIGWSDQNKFYDILNNQKIAKKSLIQYSQYLKEKVLRNEITFNSAARQQNSIIIFLSDFFENETFFSIGIKIFRRNKKQDKNTQPPSDDAKAKVLALCEHLFDGLTSLILENKEYPYKLKIPTYLNFPENALWIFPAKSWFIHPSKISTKRHAFTAYNYQLGKLNTFEQTNNIRLNSFENEQDFYLFVKKAENNIKEANQNFRHIQRIRIGAVALNAFIILFTAQTGMSWSQLINLQWDKEFKITSSNQLFRTIKWRAGGKECNFELPVGFMPRFKKFIALRDYLFNNNVFNYLFFTIKERKTFTIEKIKTFTLRGLYLTLLRIDPNLPLIQSREWRAAKSDWLVRNTDIATTALVLQNTEKTVLSSYIAGSESNHWEEMSSFLDHISKVIIPNNDVTDQFKQSAIGKCSSYGNPLTTNKNNQLSKPNCVDPEGCLFCENYKIHIDEIDIRKLLSCRYCIKKTAHLIGNLEDQQTILNPILERIDLILTQLKKHNIFLVEKIMYEVEEGELDIYWERKLEMFLELDFIT
ncbi:hypothetical protein [Acinetobacter guillouiae]|uniref:hypothetical protein n=1 Tax=Acinetobacter guillouiae TaxID=106649 RepID=UPI002FDAB099